jgi:hypothetical protein
MPFLFGALYRKLGRGYFVLYPLFELVSAFVVAPARETGDAVLLTETTRRLLGDSATGVEARGEAELRGISEPVPVYALVTSLDDRPTRPQTTLITDA